MGWENQQPYNLECHKDKNPKDSKPRIIIDDNLVILWWKPILFFLDSEIVMIFFYNLTMTNFQRNEEDEADVQLLPIFYRSFFLC